MMRPLFPVTLCCISLLSLQQQPLALPAGARLDRHRLNFLKRVPEAEEGETFIAGTLPSPGASLGPAREEAGRDWWKRLHLVRAPPLRRATEAPAQNETPPHRADAGVQQRAPRGRRHAHARGRGHHHHHHPQLMRVGCVLGTCQVQNLSHRLYQLIGQSGREDTSPMNPKSPHSYG
ncbi:protein ADM2a [Anguilla anguilla]|uniref:protein ADM2a n=1 Tax=Anguilla anguilla TaxID=7936 RepID=UPI0015B0F6FB|nr:protein ADM2a [Anguilla anguilla]XP_035280354.1 protein ADM2a [Anguilla anguilla]